MSDLEFILQSDDSMYPRVKKGESVLIDPTREPVTGDEVIVRLCNGCVMVRELLGTSEKLVHLGAVNPQCGQTAIPHSEIEAMFAVGAFLRREKSPR